MKVLELSEAQNIDFWLDGIKQFKRNELKEIMSTIDDPLEVAKLSIESYQGFTAPFGGQRTSVGKSLWENIIFEFNKFMCDEKEYIEEKKNLNSHKGLTSSLIVGTISSSIGASLGIFAGAIAAPIALLLYIAAKGGLNAYCITYYKEEEKSE